jgi:hypothetical protein
VTCGKIEVTQNVATGGGGFRIAPSYIGYQSSDNSVITMGDVFVNDNQLTCNGVGIYYYYTEDGSDLSNSVSVSLGKSYIERNT